MKKILLALLITTALHAQPWVSHLGVQLWSLHKELDAQPLKGLDDVKSFGLTLIETHSLYKMPVADFKKALDERGLKPISAHMQYDRLNTDLAGAIAEAKTLGVKYVVVPWIPHTKDFDIAAGHIAAENFNKWGAAFREAGIKFGWHPHGFEFRPEAGTTAFDVIVHETDPKNLFLEMDVFWVFHAGVDPVALLKKYPRRFELLHVKDIRKGAKTGFYTGHADEADNVAVGSGQIDWPSVLKTAKDIGVKYYFIEDETSAPMQNVPQTISYLKTVK